MPESYKTNRTIPPANEPKYLLTCSLLTKKSDVCLAMQRKTARILKSLPSHGWRPRSYLLVFFPGVNRIECPPIEWLLPCFRPPTRPSISLVRTFHFNNLFLFFYSPYLNRQKFFGGAKTIKCEHQVVIVQHVEPIHDCCQYVL